MNGICPGKPLSMSFWLLHSWDHIGGGVVSQVLGCAFACFGVGTGCFFLWDVLWFAAEVRGLVAPIGPGLRKCP